MMEKYCEMCKNPFFADANQRICNACKEKGKEQEYLEKVKEYLKENPKSAVAVVINETRVPYELLKKFVKEKRLDMVIDAKYEEQVRQEKQRLFNDLSNAKRSLTSQNQEQANKRRKENKNLSYQAFMKD